MECKLSAMDFNLISAPSQVDISAICKGDVADMLFAITFTLLSGKECTSDRYIQQEHCFITNP